MSIFDSPATAMNEEDECYQTDDHYESEGMKVWLKTVHLMTVGSRNSVPEADIVVLLVIGVVL